MKRDRQTDKGWTAQMAGQTGGQMVDGQTDRQVNRLMDGEARGQTGRQTHRFICGACVVGWLTLL